MRVLLTSTDNPYLTTVGGKHIHLRLLEKGLKEIGVQVTSLYYNPKSLIEIVKRSTKPFLGEKRYYKFKINWMIGYLMRNLPENGFELIHAHDVLSLISASKKPQKKVLTLHGYFANENIEFMKSKKNREELYLHLFQLESEGVKKADYIITVDQRLKEFIISEFDYPAGKITVMHNAVDTNLFRPVLEEEKTKLKKMFGFNEKDIIILVPRRLVEKNGVVYAVQAMKHIKDRRVKMVIAGDGPEKGRIVREANGDTRIHFAGLIPHGKIVSYYLMAEAILIPSITSHGVQEATSLAMLEGMACGKVTICSNIGGMSEIIRDMENGMLVQEKDSDSIANAIGVVISNRDLATRIGRNARENVLKNHSFDVHARKVCNLYLDLLRAS